MMMYRCFKTTQMKLTARFLFFSLLITGLFTACQKEYSVEDKANSGVIIGGGTSEGILGGNPGDCSGAMEAGVMAVGTALTDSNRLTIEMNFTQIGTYYISTDTVNGVHYSKTGVVSATGPTQITLVGSGTPVVTGSYDFTVSFKASLCTFSLTVYNVTPVTGSDYFPITAGSFWSYASSDPLATTDDTIRNVATSDLFTVGSDTYTLFTSDNSTAIDSLFFRKGTGEYHQFGDLDVAGAASNVVASDYIFLKDNVPTGTEWLSAEGDAVINSVPTKIRLKFTIAAKDVTVALGINAYNNVIKVTTSEQIQLPAGWTTALTYETWYAKGIGMINIVAPTPLYGYQLTSFKVF